MTTLALRSPTASDAAPLATLYASVLEGPPETEQELAVQLAEFRSGDAWLVEDGRAVAGVAGAALRDASLADAGIVASEDAVPVLLARVERRAAELRARTLRISARPASIDLAPHGYRLARTFLRLGADRARIAATRGAGVELVPVRATDAALHAAEEDAFAGTWGFVSEQLGAWRARVERYPAGPAFLARSGGETLGGVRAGTRLGWSWISSLVVAAHARRRGIGAQLLAAAAAALEGERIGLDVDAENAPARSLYARLGFTEVARENFWERTL